MSSIPFEETVEIGPWTLSVRGEIRIRVGSADSRFLVVGTKLPTTVVIDGPRGEQAVELTRPPTAPGPRSSTDGDR